MFSDVSGIRMSHVHEHKEIRLSKCPIRAKGSDTNDPLRTLIAGCTVAEEFPALEH